MNELEDADVCSTITLDSPKEPIVNAGRIGREDVHHQQTKRRPFIPKENDINQQRERREKNGGYKDRQKDCTCLACGYTTRELHKLLNGLHTGDSKPFLLRAPKYIKDKEAQERIHQYNLKYKEDKIVEVSDDRLDKPPQRPTLPKVNHLNSRINEKLESNVEYEQEEDEESYDEYDEMEDVDYAEDDNLPTSTVSSLNNKNLHSLPDTESIN